MGKAVNPNFLLAGIGLKPNASFGKPRLGTDFIGSCPNPATPVFESLADQFDFEIHETQIDYAEQAQAAYQLFAWQSAVIECNNRANNVTGAASNYRTQVQFYTPLAIGKILSQKP